MQLDENGQPIRLPALHPDRLVLWEGQTYITDAGVKTFYPNPRVGDIVRIMSTTNDNDHSHIYCELESRFIHSQDGVHIVAWWVRRVPHEGWVPDHIPAEA